jgi:hypothetical protein
MAFSLADHNKAQGNSTSASVTLPGGSPAQGDLMCCWVATGNARTLTQTGWNIVIADINQSGSHGYFAWKEAGAGESATVSVSIAATAAAWGIVAAVFHSTAAGSWSLDEWNSPDGTIGTATPVAMALPGATAQANEIVVAGISIANARAITSPDAGFTLSDSDSTALTAAMYHRFLAATETTSASFGYASTGNWASGIFAFKQAVAAAGPPPGSMAMLGVGV